MSFATAARMGLRRLAALALILAAVLANAPVSAGVSEHLHMPNRPGQRLRGKARLELESRWVTGNGYRPVKVTIINSPVGPTKFDRDFRVRLTPHSYYGNGGHQVRVEAIIEMPEGATSGSAWIALPQVHSWQQMDIEVREGGSRIDELSGERLQLSATNSFYGNNAYNEAMPSVLFIDSDTPTGAARDSMVNAFSRGGSTTVATPTYDLPDLRTWQNIVPHANDQWNRNNMVAGIAPGSGRASDVEVLSLLNQVEKLEIVHPSELPDQWLHYTCLDLIVISLDDLLALAKAQPDRWEAIRRWTASGPTLIVSGVGDDFKRLGELEKLVGFPPDDAEDVALEGHPGWTRARTEYAYGRVRAVDAALNSEYGANSFNADGTPLGELPPADGASKPPFALRSYGLGRVAAMVKQDPLENPPNEMAWLLNQLDPRNWMSYQRHGVSFTRQNADFMNYLIEGTGQVPVWSFLVLISGFVIVIGPVNYLLLKKRRRLYLLLVTVPAGAALITASLFGYALLSDGLGVRMRARSFTRLDQRDGTSITWARQTYYAGLAPSGGLRFPTDVAVYPIDERPWGRSSGRLRDMVWNDDDQQLRSGYISSRQTSQYLVLASGSSERKLVVKSAGANAPPKVVNQLGGHIEHLVLRDKNGNYFQLQDLAPDAEASLSVPTSATKSEPTPQEKYAAALKPFSLAYNDRRPNPPIGYETNDYGGGLFGFTSSGRRYYYDQTYERGLPTPMFSTSVLERELQRTSTNSAAQLDPGSYVVMLRESAEMPTGYSRLREQGSFHILEGRW